ncbi:MAG: hypothetical protein ABI321_07180 [Polyangia bacterium]
MRILPILAVLALVGCNDDVCAKFDGKTCIALDVRGGAGTTLSVLHVIATSGFTLDSLDSRSDNAVLSLPVAVAIVPLSDFSGDFTLDVTAQLGSSIVGQALVTATVEATKHVRVVAELDAPPVPDMTTPADLSGADMASSDMSQVVTADSECANVSTSWVTDMKSATGCADRHAGPIDTTLPSILVAGVDRIHIARNNASGLVGIVSKGYGDGGPDTVALVVSQFTGYAWPPTTLTTSHGGDSLGDRLGTSPSIAVGGDAIHLCTLDTSDSGNEVRHTTVNSTGAFIEPELVATGQGSDGEVAIALEPNGTVVCAFFNALSYSIYGARRTSGTWGNPVQIAGGFMPPSSSVGAVALQWTGTTVELVGQLTQFSGSALPIFSSYNGSNWTIPKVIDNSPPNGIYGQDVHLAHYANMNAVTYFVPNGSAWDLRLATFASASDTPVYSTIYPMAATTQRGAHHAVAYDSFGLLHVALVSPNASDPTTASLLYLRQYPDGKGGLKWLTDLVDFMAGDGSDSSSVDLVVDQNNRPHIAYYSGERGRVMYATRTDRP